MAQPKEIINVGTVANDGTGDPLRTAMIKVNVNFQDIYFLIPSDPVTGLPIPVAPVNNPVFTGDPQAPTPPPNDNDSSIATTQWVVTKLTTYATLESPTFIGDPQAPTPPVGDNDKSIATTEWVRSQNYITTIDLSAYALLDSPQFVGVPTAPTAPVVTDSTQIASTAFVQDVVAAITGGDVSSLAPKNNPVFTGDPQAPTPLAGDNDTSIATTAFVNAAILASPSIAAAITAPPAGRLTLQSGAPIMSNNVSGATSLYYTPYQGSRVPIYNGTTMVTMGFTELAALLSDTTKNPSALAATKVYDWFIWNDAGTLRLGHGPEWTNVSTRSVGTALTMVSGILLNNAAITNGPAAQRGTYVGTTYCATANQLLWQFGHVNKRARHHVWNCYNRVKIGSTIIDSTESWATGPTDWMMMNSSANNRLEAVFGLAEDSVVVNLLLMYSSSTNGYSAIGLDWVTGNPVAPTVYEAEGGTLQGQGLFSSWANVPPIGFHYWQALHATDGADTVFYGLTPDFWASGLTTDVRM